MNDAVRDFGVAIAVRVVQRLADFQADGGGLVLAEQIAALAALIEQLAQVQRFAGRAFDIVHHQIGCAFRNTSLRAGDDMRMLEPRRQLGFALEALGEVLLLGEFRPDGFERVTRLELGVLGQIDRAHPARAEQPHDPIVAQHCSCAQRLGSADARSCDRRAAAQTLLKWFHRATFALLLLRPKRNRQDAKVAKWTRSSDPWHSWRLGGESCPSLGKIPAFFPGPWKACVLEERRKTGTEPATTERGPPTRNACCAWRDALRRVRQSRGWPINGGQKEETAASAAL